MPSIVSGTNLLLGEASKSLKAFQGVITLLEQDDSQNITATLDSMVQNSRLLEDLAIMRQGLEDPTTAFLSGSGIIENICAFTKRVWKIILFMVTLIVVISVIVGLIVILGPWRFTIVVKFTIFAQVIFFN